MSNGWIDNSKQTIPPIPTTVTGTALIPDHAQIRVGVLGVPNATITDIPLGVYTEIISFQYTPYFPGEGFILQVDAVLRTAILADNSNLIARWKVDGTAFESANFGNYYPPGFEGLTTSFKYINQTSKLTGSYTIVLEAISNAGDIGNINFYPTLAIFTEYHTSGTMTTPITAVLS